MINRIFELSLRKEIYFRKYTMKFESLETSYHSIITSPKKRSTNTFSTRVEPKISISNYSPSLPTSIPYFFNFLRVDSPLEYDDVASHQKFRKRDSRRTRSPCVLGRGEGKSMRELAAFHPRQRLFSTPRNCRMNAV